MARSAYVSRMSERDQRRQLAVGAGISPADPDDPDDPDGSDVPGVPAQDVRDGVDVVQAVADLVDDLVERPDAEAAPPA
jgi:hypothetical protein